MFGFLKDKLKEMVKKLTKDVDEQAEEEVIALEEQKVEEPSVEKEEPEEKEPEEKEPRLKEGEKPPEEKHPVDEFLDEEETPSKEEPTPEEVKKKEPTPEELKKEEPEEEPEVVKEEPSEPEVVEEKPEPEVAKVKEEPKSIEEKRTLKPEEQQPDEGGKAAEEKLLEEKPPEQVEAEAKELVKEAQKVQEEEISEPTDILFEEEKSTPSVTAEDQTKTALQKVEETEKKKEHEKIAEVIEKLEEKEEKKGFFDRIKSVFSKEAEAPKAEEEKLVERALLGEGLSKEEKKYVEKTQVAKGEVEPSEEKIGEELAKEEKEPEPVKEEPKKQKVKVAEPVKEEPEEKKGFFAKLTQAVTTKTLTEKQFDEIFWELEVGLMEANVAIEVIEKIKNDLKASLVDQKVPRTKIEETIATTLSKSIDSLFDVPTIDILAKTNEKKPLTIAFFGVNGAGKTTTIAKFAHWLKKNKKTCVLAAGDTFRAAAIQQLEEHANKLGVKMIKHDYGADSAAVGFDAIKYAKQKGIDVVLIDTAGRLHSNVNLMDELKKIIRVCKPDVSLFVGECITGNDCIEQAKKFDEAVGVDGIILTKADVDDKGGVAVSVSFVTKKPILFLGVGQGYDDLKVFDKSIVLGSLELS